MIRYNYGTVDRGPLCVISICIELIFLSGYNTTVIDAVLKKAGVPKLILHNYLEHGLASLTQNQ